MKQVQISLQEVKRNIDWEKRQWLQNIYIPSEIVLSTGENLSHIFSGMCMPCLNHPLGRYSAVWDKACFKVLEGSIPFVISND